MLFIRWKARHILSKNFADGWERDGASFVVYYRGTKVIDIWGGYADVESMRKWTRDTISIAFSSTKAIGALAIAMLVDRGQLKYDDEVIKYWPEFGQHGKNNITVQWIMSHMVSKQTKIQQHLFRLDLPTSMSQ